MQRVHSILLFVIILLTGVSCSKFRKIEKSQDWRVKYEAGLNYYNKKDYYKASVLFEQIIPIVRGLPEGEKVQFNLAYCQFYDKLYLLASEQFKTFYETYGRSQMAEEARFMYAYSPLHNLREGVAYPPVLITTADTDDRVVPAHAYKFAAALQHADPEVLNQVYLRVDVKAGHGLGKPTAKVIEETADMYAFLFEMLGVG